MPLPLFCQPPWPVTREGSTRGSFYFVNVKVLLQRNTSPLRTHHLNRRLPVVARFIQVGAGKAPDLQALQVTAGCQADTQEMTVITDTALFPANRHY